MNTKEHASNKKHERGAGLVEYALLVALIAMSALTAVAGLGDRINYSFADSTCQIQTGGTGFTPGGTPC